MIPHRYFIAFFALFCSWSLSGQEDPLTLEEAVTIALDENLGIQWAEQSYEVARAADAPGAAGMLPTVTFQSQADYSLNNTDLTLISGETQSTTGASDFGVQSSIQAEWTLFDGFGKQIRKRQLELQEQQALIDYKSEAYQVTIDVARTYFQLVSLRKNLTLLQKDRQYYEELLELARQKDSLGSGTRIDILQAETDLNTLRTEIALQKRQLSATYATLNRTLNRPPDRQPPIDTTFVNHPDYDMEQLNEQAMQSNYDILRQEIRLQRAGEQLDLSDANAYPVIDLFSSVSHNYSKSDGSFLRENQSYGPTGGISLSVPIYDGNRLKRERQISEIEHQQATIRGREIEREIEQLLYDAITYYRAYREQYRLEDNNVALAGENFELADQMYRLGRITAFDLRQTRQQLLRAEQRRINAEYQLTLQRLQLIYLTGQPLLDMLNQ